MRLVFRITDAVTIDRDGLDTTALHACIDALKDALRKLVNPKTKFHHTHADTPDLKDMPDTTGDEIPAEALKFATFLKLEKPKSKSHPSRGNIH